MIIKQIAFKAAVVLSLFGLSACPVAARDDSPCLIEKIRPAVVALVAYNDKGEVIEYENGFFISVDGRLLTIRHVLKGAARVDVQTREGKVYPVKAIIAEDANHDLIQLLVEVNGDAVPYLRMTDVNAGGGDQVIAFGHQHIVRGTVSYAQAVSGAGRNFLFSAASIARATGGPVVNRQGEVIAIATGQVVANQTVTLAIAASCALALVPNMTTTLADWNARN
jgi:serine protease Do